LVLADGAGNWDDPFARRDHRRIFLMLFVLALALLQSSSAAEYPGESIDRALRENRYLAALKAAEVEAKVDTTGFMTDLLGLTQSFLSLERETLATFDSMGAAPMPDIDSSPVDDAAALDAIPAIVEAAKDRRIVILNESHHMPRHRAFATELAVALRAVGFDTFGAETFADIEGAKRRGYPDHSTGYYSQDPVFGELVRTVLGLGYECVAYEATPTAATPDIDQRQRINAREIEQARNLKERVFDANPDARLFVFVGYSHATENWVDEGGAKELAWMAARLKKLTGFDPLSIDQTGATPRSEDRFADPHWRRAVTRGALESPKVFRRDDDSYFVAGSYSGKVDLQVFHPPLAEVQGRPDWLTRGRIGVVPPKELLVFAKEGSELLLQAYRGGEDDESAIPVDQFVVRDPTAPPSFFLPRGEYRLVAQDEVGTRLGVVDNVVVE